MAINNVEQSEAMIKNTKRHTVRIIGAVLVLLILFGLVLAGVFFYFNQPPTTNTTPTTVTIESGMNVREITETLQASNIVRSDAFLYFLLVSFFEPTDIKASTYVFSEPVTALTVARRLTEGDFSSDLIKFTHFEGETAEHIAEQASTVLVDFDRALFLNRALPNEGKLFPDTYHIPPTYTAEQLVDLMLETYTKTIATYQPAITESSLTEAQVIILASIIEREANTPESMKLVSGVLQNRLEIGMPLQADASIEYILDKPLAELTPEDLEVDSPYNTYLNPGLPPTPIGNPGRVAIEAVLYPTDSAYFYYLTDDEGNFHFAESYDEHLNNIERYLR